MNHTPTHFQGLGSLDLCFQLQVIVRVVAVGTFHVRGTRREEWIGQYVCSVARPRGLCVALSCVLVNAAAAWKGSPLHGLTFLSRGTRQEKSVSRCSSLAGRLGRYKTRERCRLLFISWYNSWSSWSWSANVSHYTIPDFCGFDLGFTVPWCRVITSLPAPRRSQLTSTR